MEMGLKPGSDAQVPRLLTASLPFYIRLVDIVGIATLPEEPSDLILTYSFRSLFT